MARNGLLTVATRNDVGPDKGLSDNRDFPEAAAISARAWADKPARTDSGDGYFSKQARVSNWLRMVVSSTPIASVVSDPRLPDNPIIALNHAFVDLTGYEPQEVLDRNCRFLSGSRTEPWLSEKIREGVRDHRPVLVEIVNYKKCGTPFRNAVLVAPIFDEDDDQLCYFLGSQIEINEGDQSIGDVRHQRAVESLKQLSPRQLEVARLVAQGLLNKQIAEHLDISEKTVKMHRGLVMKKLGLSTQADLIRLAVEAGI
jgi:PAS domain S-box-containing protein